MMLPGCFASALLVSTAAIAVARASASAAVCPAGCSCESNEEGGCALEVYCAADPVWSIPTADPPNPYPRGFPADADCVVINLPGLAALSPADKAGLLLEIPAGVRLLDLFFSGLGAGAGLPPRAFARWVGVCGTPALGARRARG